MELSVSLSSPLFIIHLSIHILAHLATFVHEFVPLLLFLIFFLPIQVVLNPTTNGPKTTELHKMVIPKNSQDTDLKIKLAVRMDKPPNMKHSGYVNTLVSAMVEVDSYLGLCCAGLHWRRIIVTINVMLVKLTSHAGKRLIIKSYTYYTASLYFLERLKL